MKHRYRIGSKTDNDICLQSQYVDHYHAVIFLHEGEWYIQDLGSRFGTFIGQNKIEFPTPIPQKALIKIGMEKLDWDNFLLPQDDEPPITLNNLFSLNAVVGRKTYQALSILAALSPAIIFFALHILKTNNKLKVDLPKVFIDQIYFSIMAVLGIIFLILSIKRWRDTGKPIWLILLPIYNLYVLLCVKSSPRKTLDN